MRNKTVRPEIVQIIWNESQTSHVTIGNKNTFQYFRMGQEPTYTAHNVGFRCAASAPQLVKKMKEKEQKATTKRPQRLHKFEEMAFPQPKRTKQPKGKRAQMREFMARTNKEAIKRPERVRGRAQNLRNLRSPGMRREEL